MKLCIYHGGCTDGVAAAWAVWEADPTWTFYPGVYQQEPPWELIDQADEVLFVDFSYKREVIEDSRFRARNVTILDHHKTAQADLSPLLSTWVNGKFDMSKCGAMLAWEWFHGLKAKPELLYEIDKQDRWEKDRNPKLIMALRAWPHKPVDDSPEAWRGLMIDWTGLMSSKGIEDLHKAGDSIYMYYRQRIDETKGHERFITLGTTLHNYEVPIINAPFFMASDVAGELAEEHSGIGAVWWQNKNGDVTFSLRSRDDMDVSELARWYGGGGHKNAAGFKVSWQVAARLLAMGDVQEEPTLAMESAGMDEARHLFGHGVTRTSIRKIFRAMISKRA